MFKMQEKQLLQETIESDSSTLVRKEPLLRFLYDFDYFTFQSMTLILKPKSKEAHLFF